MKLAGLISNKGQSLLELVIAIGIFAIAISGLSFFILDSYVSGRLSSEITKANFLAEEGIEAIISIRNNEWEDLIPGEHGLSIIGNNWTLSGEEEDLKDYLREGKRVIYIMDVGEDKKIIISEVSWEFAGNKLEKVELFTYLTNWQKIPVYYCKGECVSCEGFTKPADCRNQSGCGWEKGKCAGVCNSCDSFIDETLCLEQAGCFWEAE